MNSHHLRTRDGMGGFTLLELMTAITVLAIVLGIAIPSFTNITRANQIAAASNGLVTALTLARSESVKRGIRVSVCAANQAVTACSDNPTWANGWITFTDDIGGAGQMNPGDQILETWRAPAGSVNVASAGAAAVTFTRTGGAEFLRNFTVTKAGCGDGQQRNITVNPTGRVAIARADCP